jgi:hypothetical protein
MKKRLIKTSVILLGVVLLMVAVALMLSIFSPRYFVPYVVQKVDKQTKGRYTLQINSDSVNISLFSLSLHLGHCEFVRDTTVDAYSGIDLLDKFDIHASVESLEVGSMELMKYLFGRYIVVDHIEMDQPKLIVRKNPDFDPEELQLAKQLADTLAEKSEQDHNEFADTLALQEFHQSRRALTPPIKVRSYEVKNAAFSFFDGRKKYPIQRVDGLNIHLKDFVHDKDHQVSFAEVRVYVDSLSSLVSKNLARVTVQGLDVSPDSILVKKLNFQHIVDRYRMNKIRGFRASWLNVDLEDINISGLHPGLLVTDSIVDVDHINVGYVRLNFFKDKHELIINPAHKPLPASQIRDIPIPILVDTIDIRDGDLFLEFLAPRAKTPGNIEINQFRTRLLNITNIRDNLINNSILSLNARFRIENTIPVQFSSRFKIDSETDEFSVNCQTDPFNANILNDFVGSQFFIAFRSGKINNFSFDFEGSNKANVGTMDMEYEDLKLGKFQDYARYIDTRPKTGFIAGVGNLIVPQNRSKDQKHYKQGVIYYEKEYNRDFVHGTIMSMLSGIASSMGLASKNLVNRQEKADELTNEDTQKSAEEALKKAEKSRKKEEKRAN